MFFKGESHLFLTLLMELIYKVHLMIASAASITFIFKIPCILLCNLTLTYIENPQTLILKIHKIA